MWTDRYWNMEAFKLFMVLTIPGICYGINTYDLPLTGMTSLVTPELNFDWLVFKKTYNKTYANTDEEIRRRLYWEDTGRFIEKHNHKYERGEVTFTVGENAFADMAEDEFEDIYMNGLVVPNEAEEEMGTFYGPVEDTMVSQDWREQKIVTPVRNQGSCGSCWAFASVGAIESAHAKKTGQMLDLSEQNLLDCNRGNRGNWGCRGGWMNIAFNYLKGTSGIDDERCYPYIGRESACRYRRDCARVRITGYTSVNKDESSLQYAVGKYGPVAIAMDTNNREFWYYKTGIYYQAVCNRRRPTHAMLIVGFKRYRSGEAWIIKNSWGTSWGYNGYLYLAKNRGDTCGVTLHASYPHV
ncbi:hypothetical protein ACF0H5_012671 [Mactra antiquata]